MFEVDSTRTWVDPGEGAVVGLVASLNQPLVQAAPDRPTEPTQAYIITREIAGAFEVLVYFHLLDSNVPVIYMSDESPVGQGDVDGMQDEAQDLVLSMGFLLENRDVDAAADSSDMMELPPFHEDLSPFAREEEDLDEEEEEYDEVAEFAKARQALVDAGQADASQFVPDVTDSEFDVDGELPPLVQGSENELPLVTGSSASFDTGGVADLDDMDLTGELELIPAEGTPGSQLDALLDEVDVDDVEITSADVIEPVPGPADGLDDIEPEIVIEASPGVQIEPELDPLDMESSVAPPPDLDVDELLAEVSKPPETGADFEPSFAEISDLDEGSVTVFEDDDEVEIEIPEIGDAAVIPTDKGLGEGTVGDLLDAVDALGPEPSEATGSPFAAQTDKESIGDVTMNELLDAVDDSFDPQPTDAEVDVDNLFPADELEEDLGLAGSDIDSIEIPEELLDDDVAVSAGNGAASPSQMPVEVTREDLVRLLSLL